MIDSKVWKADPMTAITINRAYECAQSYNDSGITLDGSIVTTRGCVEYQAKRNELVMSFHRHTSGYIDIKYYKPQTEY